MFSCIDVWYLRGVETVRSAITHWEQKVTEKGCSRFSCREIGDKRMSSLRALFPDRGTVGQKRFWSLPNFRGSVPV